MSRIPALVGALLLALPLAPASAQQPAAAPVTVTTTAISRVILFRINPGQGGAYNRDVLDNLIPIYEEFKKAGILVDYGFFNKATADSPDDWGVGVMLTYANWAALDNFGAKTAPITLRHYGTAERRTAAGNARNEIRTVVSTFLTGTQTFAR